jgi:hypothetical protein
MTAVFQRRNQFQPAQWNQLTRVSEDPATVRVDENQSQQPGAYATNNFYRPCETETAYANNMHELMHQYRVTSPNQCYIPVDTQMRYAPLTNQGEIYQLFTRPYNAVPYMGSGQNSGANKDLESRLIMGESTTTYKACEPLSEATINRFQCLPDYGNPQRVSHVIPPFLWGGENSRDHVRRVNYERFCANLRNKRLANKK